MPKLYWKPSNRGGWFARDEHGNLWQLAANLEQVIITTTDGLTYVGWTPEVAWKSLLDA